MSTKYGAHASCRYCGQDIEFHGRSGGSPQGFKGGWVDRGGNRACVPYKDHKTQEIVKPKTKHAPYKEHPLGPKVTAEDALSYGGVTAPKSQWRTCIVYGGRNSFTEAICHNMIEVQQRGQNGHFRVIYGLQVKPGLTYEQACQEFGECVFHLEACNGKLGNEGP